VDFLCLTEEIHPNRYQSLGAFAVVQPSSQQIDPLKIFEQAHGFYQALAILCNVDAGNTQLGVTIGEPVMVTGAFTIELFLKCLICIETGSLPPREHNLRELFDQISPTIQTKIENEWKKIAEHHTEVWDGFERRLGITRRAISVQRWLLGAMPSSGYATATKEATRACSFTCRICREH
jgi:hypothetical protein